jgi:RNA ligase (TIGR02306 family)
MSTFIVPIVTIKTVIKHPNADSLDILSFEEVSWQCVDKINTRKPGDMVVYIPIDSVVDVRRPEFEFLKSKAKADYSCRIRTIRLRGEISQGLVISMPSDMIKWLCDKITGHKDCAQGISFDIPGQDVSEYYGIKKYEPPPESIPPLSAGNYPSWCEKSDAERYQNYNRTIEPFRDHAFYKTIKMDGASITVFYDAETEHSGVCSRNWEIKENSDITRLDNYWLIAKKYNLLQIVKDIAMDKGIKRLALQGEMCGPGVQGNKMGLSELQFFAFDMYNGDIGEFIEYPFFIALCHYWKIPTVEILEVGTLGKELDTNFAYVSQLKYDNDLPAEGVVYVAVNSQRVGTLGRLKFKFINPEFLLKYD